MPGDSGEEKTLFRAKLAKGAKKSVKRLGIRDVWRLFHLAARVGSWSGDGLPGSSGGRVRGRTKRGSPLGQKRLGCPGMLPAGDGFDGFAVFGGFPGFVSPGGQVVSFGSGWASEMASFGNSRRRRLRRSNSSTARRYLRSDWAWKGRKRVKLGEYLLMRWKPSARR